MIELVKPHSFGRARTRRGRSSAGALALILVSTLGRGAYAQSDVSNKAAAEGLFDQGRELMKKGDFKRACGYLERSQQLDPAVGTLLYLAECYERGGRSASAWSTFREAADAARAIGQSERQRLAEDRASRIAPSLSRLVIEVPDSVRALPGLVIKRQGQNLPAAAWDVAVPVDPGQYKVDVSAPGHESFSGTVQVAGDASTAHLAVPALTPVENPVQAPAPPPPAPRTDQPTFSTTTPPPPTQSAPGTSSQRVAAYVLGGAGVVGLGIGSFFGFRALSKNSDAKDLCPRSPVCDSPDGVTLTEDAKSAATVSNIAFAAGGAALAGGIILFLTSPSAKEESPKLDARITPSGVWLNGAF